MTLFKTPGRRGARAKNLKSKSAEKPKGTFRSLNDTFRREAVEFLLTSGRPLSSVAQELGITANSLRTWRNRLAPNRGATRSSARTAASAHRKPEAAETKLDARISRLQQENTRFRRQRDVLIKAMSVLGQDLHIDPS